MPDLEQRRYFHTSFDGNSCRMLPVMQLTSGLTGGGPNAFDFGEKRNAAIQCSAFVRPRLYLVCVSAISAVWHYAATHFLSKPARRISYVFGVMLLRLMSMYIITLLSGPVSFWRAVPNDSSAMKFSSWTWMPLVDLYVALK